MTDRQYVYIAGPYTYGEWGTNIRRAVQAAERVWQAGHVPFIPHTMTALWSIVTVRDSVDEWLEYDRYWLDRCDALVRLPGESAGSDAEVEYAHEHDIPVYHGVGAFLSTGE